MSWVSAEKAAAACSCTLQNLLARTQETAWARQAAAADCLHNITQDRTWAPAIAGVNQEDGGEGGRGQSAGGQSAGGGAPRPAPVCPGGPGGRGGQPHTCQVTPLVSCHVSQDDCFKI